MNDDEMPAFRKPQLLKMVEDSIYHTKSNSTSMIFGAYERGFSDGRNREKLALIGRLQAYQADSVVAKLLAEMLQKESDES